jgi:hypothetical protein
MLLLSPRKLRSISKTVIFVLVFEISNDVDVEEAPVWSWTRKSWWSVSSWTPLKVYPSALNWVTKQAERVRPLEIISERINKRWRNADDQSCECREGEMRRFLRKWSHFDRAPFSAGGGVRRTNFFSCSQPTEKLRSILGTFAPGHPAMLTSGLNIS